MEQQTDLFSSAIRIDETAKMHIRAIASWAMVIVVATVLGYILNILELIINPYEPVVNQAEGFSASILVGEESIVIDLIAIIIGLMINYSLYRFASNVVSSIDGMKQEKFRNSFRNLKIYFAVTSIVMILLMLILLIVIFAFL